MRRHRYDITEAKILKWREEGRGLGRGSSYKPWLTIHDVPSLGLLVRVRGSTTWRIHHLLSGVERAAFLECDWSSAIVDIREQFPLPRTVTRRIAAEMGVRHPRSAQTDAVMTTDLLLDVVGQDEQLSFSLPPGVHRRRLALSIKNTDEDLSLRACEKLEIERRYWASLNVAWTLLFKYEMPEKRWLKLMWLHEWRSLDFMSVNEARIFRRRCETVVSSLAAAPSGCAGAFTERLDAEQGWPPGTTLSALRHLAANRRVLTCIDRLYDAWEPISQFTIPAESVEARLAS